MIEVLPEPVGRSMLAGIVRRERDQRGFLLPGVWPNTCRALNSDAKSPIGCRDETGLVKTPLLELKKLYPTAL